MTNSIIWLKNGRTYKQIEDSVSAITCLEPKIYTICMDANSGELYLEEFADKFTFNYKLYGLRNDDLKHILKTYEATDSNLGVLCNGFKGSSKTVFCKRLANAIGLPVLICQHPYPGLIDFISKINCPCTIFFDEFEKNFDSKKGNDKTLLTIMDGVFNSEARKVFLLTTNNLYVNENFLNRPSRIRYRLQFGNLPFEVIKEYCDDQLEYPEFFNDIYTYINSLEISTIDILKTIVEEVNIHKCTISSLKDVLNIDIKTCEYASCMTYTDLVHFNEAFIDTFLKNCALPYTHRNYPRTDTLRLQIPFESLEVNDIIQNSKVFYIDKDRKLLGLRQYDSEIVLYHINYEYKHSIYKQNAL